LALITLKHLLDHAAENSYGLPAFNLNIVQIKAVMQVSEEIHQMIRALIEKINTNYAKRVKIIYRGSSMPKNSEALFSIENIDGGLAGRCSIDPQALIKLCYVVDQLNYGEKI